MKEWERLMAILDKMTISEGEDSFVWLLEKSGHYTTRSMYRRLSFRRVVNRRMVKLWKSKIPMKLKVFMWMVINGKLQTGVNLMKNNWRESGKCCLCGEYENEDHIFFGCVLAITIWACFKEALGWDRMPRSLQDFFEEWLPLHCSKYHVKFFYLCCCIMGDLECKKQNGDRKEIPKLV